MIDRVQQTGSFAFPLRVAQNVNTAEAAQSRDGPIRRLVIDHEHLLGRDPGGDHARHTARNQRLFVSGRDENGEIGSDAAS